MGRKAEEVRRITWLDEVTVARPKPPASVTVKFALIADPAVRPVRDTTPDPTVAPLAPVAAVLKFSAALAPTGAKAPSVRESLAPSRTIWLPVPGVAVKPPRVWDPVPLTLSAPPPRTRAEALG